MDGYNASGRRVSLLVEDDTANDNRVYAYDAFSSAHSLHSSAPELSRSGSFDSQTSHGPETPLTPESTQNEHSASYAMSDFQSPFCSYQADGNSEEVLLKTNKYTSYSPSHLSMPYLSTEGESVSERKGKRFPCRLAQEFGCDKTFTTSGHASRHAKIHSAVKTIPCSFEGCQKMFTRTDNMKQHLETHFKRDRIGRSGSSGHPSASSKSRPAQAGNGLQARCERFDETDYSSGIESNLTLRPAYGRAQPRSSIDGMSLATLANAARQVEDEDM